MTLPSFDGSLEAWLIVLSLAAVGGLFVWIGQVLEAPALSGLGAMGVIASLLWAEPALARQQEDMEALASKAKARGEAEARALAPWAASLKPPSFQHKRAAADIGAASGQALETGRARLDRPGLQAPGDMAVPSLGPGTVYVAVSLSMPPEALRRLSRDAAKAGVRLVLRGPTEGSFKTLAIRLRQVFDQSSLAGVGIDPQVFRGFEVRAAPTFIAAEAALQPCGALGCTPHAPGFDKVSGNISLRAALEALSEAGGPGAPAAASALKRLVD